MLDHLGRRLLALASLVVAVGCSASAEDDGGDASGEALSGRVTPGRVVETAGDALRLRRTPSRTTTDNIVGVLPKGTSVKLLEAAPNDGFYRVEVQSQALASKLRVSTGWVYGEYLSGASEEPEDPDASKTGTWDVPTQMRAKLVVARCDALRDDQGNAFGASLDDAIAGRSPWAAVGFDTNTFAAGMKVTIDQVSARSAQNPSGKAVKLKIAKTAARARDEMAPFTVTVCTRTGTAPALTALATEDGFVDVSVYAYW
jgi:hypothetical protein